jgi:predicted phosphodiesterase
VADGVTRILSDLHYRDHGGLRRLDEVGPLLEGVDAVILNGDSLESRTPEGPEVLAEVRAFFAATGVPTRFLSGNHGPDISPDAEAVLARGKVWVTHGDIFWDDAAPWSRFASQVHALVRDERQRRGLDPRRARLEDLLAAHRVAHLRGGAHHRPGDRSWRARLEHLVQTLFPPTQVLRMVGAWRTGPERAAQWARRHRPEAHVVVFGHIHRRGVWQPPGTGLIVINTGAFGPPLGPQCVDLDGQRVRVRRLVRRKGLWHPGEVRHDFALANPPHPKLSAAS